MKINLITILVLFLVSLEGYAQEIINATPEPKVTAEDLKNLPGEWTGTLTYVDYSSNKPYTMPANLRIEQGKNEFQLLLFNIYPNEPKANSKGTITISKGGRQVNKKEVKLNQRLSNGQIQIITEYVGKDNKQSALIRNIYTLGENLFVIRKEVQFENTSDWIMRNEFSYKK